MTNDRRIDYYEDEINFLNNFWVIARQVLEGHEVLRNEIQGLGRRTDERFDTVNFKFDTLNVKVDSVADDLAEHRRDTEAHKDDYKAMDPFD